MILNGADWWFWLGGTDRNHLEQLQPAESGVVRLWPLSRAVNSVRNNGTDLLDCIDDPVAPPSSDAPAGDNPF
jgi:putative SOS response-associated peptidase YedK